MESREVSAAVPAMLSAESAIRTRPADASRRATSSAILLHLTAADPENGVLAKAVAAAAAGSERGGTGILPEIEPVPDSLQSEQRQGTQDLSDTLLPVAERQKLPERAVPLQQIAARDHGDRVPGKYGKNGMKFQVGGSSSIELTQCNGRLSDPFCRCDRTPGCPYCRQPKQPCFVRPRNGCRRLHHRCSCN